MNDEPDLAGVSGELTAEEAAALRDAPVHPLLRRIAEAWIERRDDD